MSSPERDKAWQMVLNKIDELGEGLQLSSRSMGYHLDHPSGNTSAAAYATFQKKDHDGTNICYFVQATYDPYTPNRSYVTVDKSVSNQDWFWDAHVENYDERTVIVDATHYRLGSPVYAETNTNLNGFGGRMFHILFNDGRLVKTNNLWYQGVIPPAYRDTLADNAEFVEESYQDVEG